MTARAYIYVFSVAAVTHLLVGMLGWEQAGAVSKVLLLPALAGYYLKSLDTRSLPFLAGLFFCWVGDVLLIFDGYFIGGLVSFLLGHILYIFSYRQHQWEDRSRELLATQKVRFSLPIVLTGTGLVVVLYPRLNGLQVPVMVYAMAITVMVMTAMFRYGRTPSQSFWLVFGGAVLFMASDSVLAISRFLSPVPHGRFWIMLTYMSAQLMIVTGIVRHR